MLIGQIFVHERFIVKLLALSEADSFYSSRHLSRDIGLFEDNF